MVFCKSKSREVFRAAKQALSEITAKQAINFSSKGANQSLITQLRSQQPPPLFRVRFLQVHDFRPMLTECANSVAHESRTRHEKLDGFEFFT
jgi:hypothetical protein